MEVFCPTVTTGFVCPNESVVVPATPIVTVIIPQALMFEEQIVSVAFPVVLYVLSEMVDPFIEV